MIKITVVFRSIVSFCRKREEEKQKSKGFQRGNLAKYNNNCSKQKHQKELLINSRRSSNNQLSWSKMMLFQRNYCRDMLNKIMSLTIRWRSICVLVRFRCCSIWKMKGKDQSCRNNNNSSKTQGTVRYIASSRMIEIWKIMTMIISSSIFSFILTRLIIQHTTNMYR